MSTFWLDSTPGFYPHVSMPNGAPMPYMPNQPHISPIWTMGQPSRLGQLQGQPMQGVSAHFALGAQGGGNALMGNGWDLYGRAPQQYIPQAQPQLFAPQQVVNGGAFHGNRLLGLLQPASGPVMNNHFIRPEIR